MRMYPSYFQCVNVNQIQISECCAGRDDDDDDVIMPFKLGSIVHDRRAATFKFQALKYLWIH